MAEKKKFYAVRQGRKAGIYTNWLECKEQITGFAGASYKGFATLAEAQAYLAIGTAAPAATDYLVYVDGSYIDGQYSWAFAAYHQEALCDQGSGVGTSAAAAKMRNVAGEIEAAEQAVRWALARGIDHVVICHDYEGIASWAQGLWKANLPETQAYARFMQQHGKLVSFRKVAGHTGVAGNEYVDKLAKEALGLTK